MQILENPTTLKIFLYCLNRQTDVGIRQTQKDLIIKSTSTVHWHFQKLEEADYLERHPDNNYTLTQQSRSLNSLELYTKTSFKLINGRLVPYSLMLLSFLISSLIAILVMSQFSQSLALFQASLTLVVTIIIIAVYYWRLLQEQHVYRSQEN